MSNKSLLKLVVGFGLLAVVLIFLGVNFVPRISASSSGVVNYVVSGNQTRPDYLDERYPRAILDPRIPQANALSVNYYIGSDWIERHPVSITQALFLADSDWIERHPSNYYSNSDWIERHPSNVVTGFRTPAMSNYAPSIAVTGFHTPAMSNYAPSIAVIGFRTPPMSNYIRPIGTERFFTPPNVDYTP